MSKYSIRAVMESIVVAFMLADDSSDGNIGLEGRKDWVHNDGHRRI